MFRSIYRFDTRNKKPKLWSLLILSAVTALILALVLIIFGNSHASVAVCESLLCAYLTAALIILAVSFVHQMQYNPYSYNSIYYSGFFVFTAFVLISDIVIFIYTVLHPDQYQSWRDIAGILMDSAKNFMSVTLPFMTVFAAGLLISNISLIRHEGKRFVNILGMILAVMIIAGEALLIFIDRMSMNGALAGSVTLDIICNIYAALFFYFECMLIGIIISSVIVIGYRMPYDRGYMIILGCGIRKDGTPTPILKGRIDRALGFRNDQLEKTGKDLVFVASGGKGPDEVISESECIRNYLITQGVPEDSVIMEDRSTDTMQNMKFSKEKIGYDANKDKVAFCTTNYHLFRSGLLSRRVKMRAAGICSVTRWYFWPNAAVREFVGLLVSHKLKQFIIIMSLILFYTVLTILIYNL